MSTILLAALVAASAPGLAQEPAQEFTEKAFWLSAQAGTMRSASVSDRASEATWLLERSTPVAVSLEWGRRDVLIGMRLQGVRAPMTFAGASCVYCDGSVQAITLLGTLRRTAPLFTSSFRQMVELGAGVTTWRALRGRNGAEIDGIAPIYDFTFAAGIGLGHPIGERLEASANFEVVMARHQLEQTSAPHLPTTQYIGLPVLRVGVRYRLGPD